jgi:hypothetical protein
MTVANKALPSSPVETHHNEENLKLESAADGGGLRE